MMPDAVAGAGGGGGVDAVAMALPALSMAAIIAMGIYSFVGLVRQEQALWRASASDAAPTQSSDS